MPLDLPIRISWCFIRSELVYLRVVLNLVWPVRCDLGLLTQERLDGMSPSSYVPAPFPSGYHAHKCGAEAAVL